MRLRRPRNAKVTQAELETWGEAMVEELYAFRKDEHYVALFARKGLAPYLYLVKGNMNPQVVAEVRFRDSVMEACDGRWAVDEEYFNSNMREFDTKVNNGKAPEHYGIAVTFPDVEGMREFLRAFNPGRPFKTR